MYKYTVIDEQPLDQKHEHVKILKINNDNNNWTWN